MSIRILHIVGIMNVGGIETLLMNIYRNIDKEKIQFDFLVTREEKGFFDDEILSFGGKIYNIPSLKKVGFRQYKNNLLNFFQTHREYNIVHCHRDALCALYLREAKKAKIPIRIAHCHTTKIIEPKGVKGSINTLIKKYFKCISTKYATNYFACSKESAVWLFGKSIGQSAYILKNGIYLDNYAYDICLRNKVRQELNISDDTFLLGHVGSFTLPKNHNFIIKVFSNLKQQKNNVKLLLVGSGNLEGQIRENIKYLGIEDDVIFLGVRNDVNKLLMAIDLFVFPSLFEGLGIALLEAQATGLECLISSNIPNEVDMGLNLLHRIPLNEELWVNFINENKKEITTVRRFSNLSKVRENGYDIVKSIGEIEELYIDLNKKLMRIYYD